jgi:hypothetical protein
MGIVDGAGWWGSTRHMDYGSRRRLGLHLPARLKVNILGQAHKKTLSYQRWGSFVKAFCIKGILRVTELVGDIIVILYS